MNAVHAPDAANALHTEDAASARGALHPVHALHAMNSVHGVHALIALQVFPMGNGGHGVVILEDLRFGRAGQVHNVDNVEIF